MSKVNYNPSSFVADLNTLRLRFQDMHRDLVEMTKEAVDAGFLGDNEKFTQNSLVTNAIYDSLFELGEAVGNDFDINPWDDINEPQGLAKLVVEEFTQANEKAIELGGHAKIKASSAEMMLEDMGWMDYPVAVIELMEDNKLQEAIQADFAAGLTYEGVVHPYASYEIHSLTPNGESSVCSVFFTLAEAVDGLDGKAESYIIS